MDGDATPLVSTGYLAHRFGCSVSAIKGWERDGRIKPALRVLGSDRRVWPIGDLPRLEEQIDSLLRGGRRRRAEGVAVRA